MTKRIASLVLAIAMILQTLVPQISIAKDEVKPHKDNLVTVGMINGNSYDAKLMLELNRLTAKNRREKFAKPGTSLFGYFEEDQEPKDGDKLKYHGEVKADLKVRGIDGGEFPWKDIFGKEEVHLRFIQMNDDTGVETGVERVLNITKAGKYTWTDGEGNPAELPLFNNKLEPLTYEVKLDEEVSDKVKLLTARLTTTGNAGSPTFDKPDAKGRIKYHLTLEIGLQQVASSKFVSEWHTEVEENARPQLEGTMTGSMDNGKSKTINFNLPANDNDEVIVRTASRRDKNKFLPEFLFKTPTTDIKTDTAGLTFDTTNKIVKSGDHKYKYNFTYDVINGGKLTMTEILPVTFDANGGKFASISGEGAEQKIVKEVEYDGTLTDKAEEPKKELETFKGWSTTEDGKTPVTDADFKNIKEAKTFYAIWDNNDIVAKELEVKESFKDGTGYVNDFIPTLDTLKGQVKIKDGSGKPQALANDDTFEILNDSGTAISGDALKDYLYGKLQEKDNPNDEPTRVETVNAKITHKNGTVQTVDIPIKVIKNIYEAKTETKPPYYVPKDYVKVTVDPTTKATDPQKTYYYVNPAAKVVIPGNNPVGTGDNTFTKWLIDGTDTVYELAKKPRHQFDSETTIKAQYVSDVIPASSDGSKVPGTPDNFVKVTFVPTDNGTLEGNSIFYVNPEKEVTIPVANPVAKQYYTFKEWKMGADAKGETYNPSTPKKFTDKNGTTITATYDEANNIIPYDPNSPITQPEGYIRVRFEAEKGLTLNKVKYYYVKKNAKDAQGQPLTLKDIKDNETKYGYPGYTEETGYKFDKWDKDDSLAIEAADIVVTAKSTKLDNVIPEKDSNGKTNDKPEGYKEVTFVVKSGDETKGSITGVAKFYVNPNEYVTINPPTTKANNTFEFGSWDKDATIPTVYKDDTTITGSFNDLEAVIPKTKPDGTDNIKPAGYRTVTFVIDPATGGKIADDEITVYYVNPAKDVTVPQPKTQAETGYEFEKWDQDTTTAKKYTDDTTVKGNFKKLDDIIPATKDDGTPNAKPDGYVTLTFVKGEHGKDITGQTVYYVNPKADPVKTLANIIKPTVTADTGYIQKTIVENSVNKPKWDTEDTFEIKADKIVTPIYEKLRDVIPKEENGEENAQPDGYITVTFVKGDHGKELTGQAVYYVNPNKVVILKDKAPTAVPNTGYKFARWDVSIDKAIQYKDKDKITALYNQIGSVIPKVNDKTKKPDGYVTVTFDKGTNGKEITGTTVYYVDPNREVNLPSPTVTPNIGWEQKTGDEAWDSKLTRKFTDENTTITAQYKELGDMIPQKKTDGSDKPTGYKIVKFVGEHGTLSETTVYYVNPEKEVDFTNTVKVFTKTPDFAYTEVGGTWSSEEFNKKFTDDATFTFTFKKLDNVIPKTKNDESEKPKGYVKVTLIPTDKATDSKKIIYFVNPKENVSIKSKPTGKTETINDIEYTYVFKGWTVTRGTIASWDSETIAGKFIQETEITAKYTVQVDQKELKPAPIAKKDVITPVGVEPKAEDLIENIPGSQKNPLPNGTTFDYADDGKPDVSKAGNTTAKVKVTYPSGKTVVVEVPITVVDNVIPQEGDKKPDNVPKDFVKVEFVPTDKGTMEGAKIFWVKPNVDVIIPVKDPVGNGYNIFKEWKFGVNADGDVFKKDEAKQFTAQETTITATYNESENIKPFDPKDKDPMVRPEGYVRVTFDADLGLKLTESKAYYVKKNAGVKLSKLPKPSYDKAKGYDFDKWDKEDTLEIKDEDLVVTAKAKLLPEPECKGGGVVYVPSIAPKDSGKRADADKSAKYLEVKYMQGHDNMFMPYKSLSRAEAAQILANALISDGYKYLDIDANTYYSDLKPNAWYLKAVSIVTQAGVFEGFDGKFMPDRSITQGEWIATLVRFQMQGKMKGNAMRVNERHWAKEEVQSAYSVGWLKIYTDGTMPFNVDKAITREEVAAVTNRAFNRVRDFEYELKNENRLYNFKDISRDMWSYYDILCATNTFVHNKKNYLSHEIDYRKYTADYKYEDLIVDHFQRVLRQKNN